VERLETDCLGRWGEEVFSASLKALDDYIGSGRSAQLYTEKLFPGALADMLTHIGQISMLRRLAGFAGCARKIILAPKSLLGRVGAEQLRLRGNSIDRKAVSLGEFSSETNDVWNDNSKRRKTAGGLG